MERLTTYKTAVFKRNGMVRNVIKAHGYRKTKHFYVFIGVVSGKTRIKHSDCGYASIATSYQ